MLIISTSGVNWYFVWIMCYLYTCTLYMYIGMHEIKSNSLTADTYSNLLTLNVSATIVH